jgi:hypothetical protein
VPENVPLISDRERIQLRAASLSPRITGPSQSVRPAWALTTGQPDEETAKVAALNACRIRSNQDELAVECELYVVGNKVNAAPTMGPAKLRQSKSRL